ncbi:kinase-like protein, partial [Wolfiporia cocos MD-104 SS10]
LGRMYSPRFPAAHALNPFFVRAYHLGDELGAGGYGFVMTARHRAEGHEVAVKFIVKEKVPEHAWWEDEAFGRVPTEVMLLSLVDHPNIVKCLDLYEDERYFYMSTPDVAPHTPPSISQSKHKRLSESQARFVFAQVVEAVHYLARQGITHCDIKDENLLVDSELRVKLIDFGSAVVADPRAPHAQYYTLFFGTTAYAASEILRKQPYRAPPAEVWTLGVLLSYLLTGHSPFATEQDAIDGRVALREPAAGRLSRAAVALVKRCLERDPERRADIEEVRNHRWLAGALERGAAE